MRLPSLCWFCKHYHEGEYIDPENDEEEVFSICDAYPKGIPHAVFWGGHVYPKPNDNGIQFELKDGAKFPEHYKCTQEEENKAYQFEFEYYSVPPEERTLHIT